MTHQTIFLFAVTTLIAALSSACLIQETVTVNGQVQKEGYVVKRPIKDVIGNSQ
jgi:outer membrane protein assembly factor BamE (lipoprotein component of BamABCDE complex)